MLEQNRQRETLPQNSRLLVLVVLLLCVFIAFMFSLFSLLCFIDVFMMCVLSHLNKDYLLTYNVLVMLLVS